MDIWALWKEEIYYHLHKLAGKESSCFKQNSDEESLFHLVQKLVKQWPGKAGLFCTLFVVELVWSWRQNEEDHARLNSHLIWSVWNHHARMSGNLPSNSNLRSYVCTLCAIPLPVSPFSLNRVDAPQRGLLCSRQMYKYLMKRGKSKLWASGNHPARWRYQTCIMPKIVWMTKLKVGSVCGCTDEERER